MIKQIVAAILALVLAVNGLAMLFAGSWWYGAVPGVTSTGPFNPHFVMDIGVAYLVAAGGLAWRALKPADGQGALVAAAGFLILHAVIHLIDAARGGHGGHDLARDFPGVFVPAIVAGWLAWPASRRA